MELAYSLADAVKTMIHKRTGLEPNDLQCPREKSSMTPCIARDGRTAVAFGAGKYAVCAGCDASVESLHKKELALSPASEVSE